MLLGRIIMLPYGKKIPDLRFPTSPGNNTVREEEVDFTKPYFGKKIRIDRHPQFVDKFPLKSNIYKFK
jgi:hypothetical protein